MRNKYAVGCPEMSVTRDLATVLSCIGPLHPLHIHVTGIFRESVLWCQQSLTRLNIPNTQPAHPLSYVCKQLSNQTIKMGRYVFFQKQMSSIYGFYPNPTKIFHNHYFLRHPPTRQNHEQMSSIFFWDINHPWILDL